MAAQALTTTPRKYELVGAIPFALAHAACFLALWTGITWEAVALGLGTFGLRMFAVTGGYHRYFSHRSFKTSRVGQFVLAFLAETSLEKGVLWWAAHHRTHHKNSDLPGDLHSPVRDGFWYSHVGWLFNGTSGTDLDKVRDLARYPELRFIDCFYLLPPLTLALATFWVAGWPGLIVGFFWSTVAHWHANFAVNSVSHLVGSRRYATSDDSRNSLVMALLTFGEGWHNNHHRYMASTRQGFYWWEIDVTYYILKALSWVGLVWDSREPPPEVLEEGRAAARSRAPALKRSAPPRQAPAMNEAAP